MQPAALVGLSLALVLLPTATANSCSFDGEIKLVNQNSTYTDDGQYVLGGRVEVCFNGTLHSVCTEGWDDSDAQVVCNYLGYSYYGNSRLLYIHTMLILHACISWNCSDEGRVWNK